MEEGTETPKYLTILPFTVRCRSPETLLYYVPSARIPALPWTVFIFLPEK